MKNKIILCIFISIFSMSQVICETQENLKIDIATTDKYPNVNQTFKLQVTITNQKSESITSSNNYIIEVISQTNDTNIEYISDPNSTLDSSEIRTEEWEVSFNTSGIKIFNFRFDSSQGDSFDIDFEDSYNIEVGSTDQEPGERDEDVGFEGPTNSTSTDFITEIGGTGAIVAVFGIAFLTLGYLLISKMYSHKKEV